MTEKEVAEMMGISYWQENPPVAWLNKELSDFGAGEDNQIPVFTFDTVLKLAKYLKSKENK